MTDTQLLHEFPSMKSVFSKPRGYSTIKRWLNGYKSTIDTRIGGHRRNFSTFSIKNKAYQALRKFIILEMKMAGVRDAEYEFDSGRTYGHNILLSSKTCDANNVFGEVTLKKDLLRARLIGTTYEKNPRYFLTSLGQYYVNACHYHADDKFRRKARSAMKQLVSISQNNSNEA